MQTSNRRIDLLRAGRTAAGAFWAFCALLAVASCSFNQKLTVATDGSGSADIRVALSPMLTSYMEDLAASFGGSTTGANGGAAAGNPPIFNVTQLKEAFLATGGVDSVSASTPDPSTLLVHLSFTDIRKVFAAGRQPGLEQPLSFSDSGGIETLRLRLSRDNFAALSGLPPFKDNPALLSLAPQGSRRYTEQQYLDVLGYAFGDYANGASVADIVRGSTIQVTVRVRGRLVSQTGGVVSGESVRFSVPLLRVLTLEEPIDYSVSFR